MRDLDLLTLSVSGTGNMSYPVLRMPQRRGHSRSQKDMQHSLHVFFGSKISGRFCS
jgi:hypothetical protein